MQFYSFYNYLLFYINKYENIKKRIDTKVDIDEKIELAKRIINQLFSKDVKGE